MCKQAPYGEDLNSFWADDALACGSMPSSDRRREVVDPQRSGTGAEEQIVEQPFVLEDQRAEFVWQGEDDVEVRHGQQFSRPRWCSSLPREKTSIWLHSTSRCP